MKPDRYREHVCLVLRSTRLIDEGMNSSTALPCAASCSADIDTY